MADAENKQALYIKAQGDELKGLSRALSVQREDVGASVRQAVRAVCGMHEWVGMHACVYSASAGQTGSDIGSSPQLQSAIDTLRPRMAASVEGEHPEWAGQSTGRGGGKGGDRPQRCGVVEEVLVDEPAGMKGYKVLTARQADHASVGISVATSTRATPGPGTSRRVAADQADSGGTDRGSEHQPKQAVSSGSSGKDRMEANEIGDAGDYVLVMDANGSRWDRVELSTPAPARNSDATRGGRASEHPTQDRPRGILHDKRSYVNAPEIAAVVGAAAESGDEIIELRLSSEGRPLDRRGSGQRSGRQSEMPDLPTFSGAYTDLPLHRVDGPARVDAVGGGEGADEVRRVFGGRVGAPPGISRIKVHSEPTTVEEDRLIASGGDSNGEANGGCGLSRQASLEGNAVDGVESVPAAQPAPNELVKLLEALVAAHPQTLQQVTPVAVHFYGHLR